MLSYIEWAWLSLLTLPPHCLQLLPCMVSRLEAGRRAPLGEALFLLMRTPLVLDTLDWGHPGARTPQSVYSVSCQIPGIQIHNSEQGPSEVHGSQGPHVRKLSLCELK